MFFDLFKNNYSLNLSKSERIPDPFLESETKKNLENVKFLSTDYFKLLDSIHSEYIIFRKDGFIVFKKLSFDFDQDNLFDKFDKTLTEIKHVEFYIDEKCYNVRLEPFFESSDLSVAIFTDIKKEKTNEIVSDIYFFYSEYPKFIMDLDKTIVNYNESFLKVFPKFELGHSLCDYVYDSISKNEINKFVDEQKHKVFKRDCSVIINGTVKYVSLSIIKYRDFNDRLFFLVTLDLKKNFIRFETIFNRFIAAFSDTHSPFIIFDSNKSVFYYNLEFKEFNEFIESGQELITQLREIVVQYSESNESFKNYKFVGQFNKYNLELKKIKNSEPDTVFYYINIKEITNEW